MSNPVAAFKCDEITVHESRTLSHPLSELHILKNGDSFAIFNHAGDIKTDEYGPDGLFLNDTRLISHWHISLENTDLQVLNHSIDDYHILFTAHFACKGFMDMDCVPVGENRIYIKREKFIRKGTMYERISLENHMDVPVRVRLSLQYGSDFYDMFQVRGIHRRQQGIKTDIETGADKVTLRYRGLDGKARRSVIRFSEAPHSLTAYRALFEIRLEKGERKVMAATGGMDPGVPPSPALFEKTLTRIQEQIQRRLRGWTGIRTANSHFDEWLESSRIGISLLTTLRHTGLYPYAGIPWFSTPFGRDGIITALQTLWVNTDIARGVLSFLAQTQAQEYDEFRDAEPGKILHELREGEMARTGEVPFGQYYGSIDSTPLFIMLAGAYYRHTSDIEFTRDLWPGITAALEWMEKDGDLDQDGFLEYSMKRETGLYNQGWKDSADAVFHADGSLAKLPIALCEVQAYAYAALKEAAFLAQALKKHDIARQIEQKAARLYERVNEVFWSEELGCYALALDGDKKPCLVRSSNNGHMLWCGIAPPDRAQKIADMLMGPDFFTGWGIRTIAESEVRYNPLSYHNGSVWPHDTAIAAAGLARYGYYDKAQRILNGLFDASKDCQNYWLPELFCGFSRLTGHDLVRYPAACTLQAWACGSVFMALQAALGLSYDFNAGSFTVENRELASQEQVVVYQGNETLLSVKNIAAAL
jgi:glycogen debranching enzyme